MTSCPSCSKPVDPLRSRFVGVIDGKVVGFCSAECAAKGGVASASGPVAAPAIAAAATAAAVDPARPAMLGEPAVDPARPPGAKADARPETKIDARPETKPETKIDARPETKPEAKPDAKPEAKADAKAGKKGKKPASAQTPSTGVPLGPPRPETPAPGVPISLESGPVIEIIREPASSGVAAPDKTGRAKHPDEISIKEFWTADKEKSGARGLPSEAPGKPAPARAPSEPEPELDGAPRKSRAPLVILLLVVLAIGGFLAYQHFARSDASAATKPTPSARGPDASNAVAPTPLPAAAVPRSTAAPHAPEKPQIDPPTAEALARAKLDDLLHATSQRVQHLAATALARTRDPAALAVITGQLGLAPAPPRIETSDLAKLDLAYALARGGDARGAGLLVAGLRSVRGDVRDEAARLLVLLGDARGVPHLLDLLQIPQRRLGAAEQLVHLQEPHAMKTLDQLRADARTSPDDKARATIALGVARRADVAPALHDLLADLHESAFAAAALAEQHDAAARPVLEQQLASPALRVRAALALRRLAPALDPAPLLPGLVAVVKTGRDTDQVAAAEAILLLTGPAAWATYD
ncbi:MAG TPA: hypothetical protein VFP84_14890 [Kofleriaceae bacterium]|nr:hypothetical protein [Kofleriaceae bacterium]